MIIITRQSPADEKGRVTRISAGKEPGRVGVDFLHGFPNLHALPKGNSSAGQWSIRIRASYQAGQSGHMLEKQSYEIYRELGTAHSNRFLDMASYCRFTDEASGRSVQITPDLDLLAKELKLLF